MRGAAHKGGAPPGAAGFFGKVPEQGDFVASRFDRGLREPLDRWAQAALAHCRRVRGERWKDAFLAMPPFRFVLGAHLVGGEPAIGVMVASVDRVGRPFPLFLSQRLSGHRGPTRLLARQQRWFEDAEALAVSARGSVLRLDDLDRRLTHLVPEPPAPDPALSAGREADRSFWWTEGADRRRFAAQGFPAPEEFDRFLGEAPDPPPEQPRQMQEQQRAASALPGVPAMGRAPRPTALPNAASAPPFVRPASVSHASHEGTRLRINVDALLSAEDGHLYAIVGGHGSLTATPAAARLVVDRLGRLTASPRVADLAAETKGALGSASTLLRRDGGETPDGGVAAVVLALAPDGYAVVWAGDMRCYLLRDGMMRCLTRDHVGIGLDRRLSRSVGGAAQFACDVVSGGLQAGDRFLLSSASLTRALPERDVATRLIGAESDEAAQALVEDALVAGVRENVSTIVVTLR